MAANASPNANTFELVPPRRPGAADFNGIAKIDVTASPPDPQTQPNAYEWNTLEFLAIAAGKMIPVAILSVTGGSSPVINAFTTASSLLVLGTFTITRVSAGVVQITWAAGTFPTAATQPKAHLNGTTAGMVTCENISNGVQVNTFNASGAVTDLSFTVDVM